MEPDSTTAAEKPARSLWLAWLQLLRAPNLLTVPGDPIAGFFLAALAGAHAGRPAASLACLLPAAASLLLYMAGLLQNDFFDLQEDRRDRPQRPLASGQINPYLAISVSVVLILLAIGAGAAVGYLGAIVAAVLSQTIIAYNRFTKRLAVVGPINMGLCRGLSLLLGAAAGGWTFLATGPVVISAIGLTAYIAAVTHIARNETTGRPVGQARFIPPLIVLAWFAALASNLFDTPGLDRTAAMVPGLVALVALMHVTATAASLAGQAQPALVQAGIGRFIKALLLIQAALAAIVLVPGGYFAAALVAAIPLNNILRRWFYAS